MRRSRGGWSGSLSFLSRALKHPEAELGAALAALGLHLPESGAEKAAQLELGGYAYWLNKDGRGQVWINGCEKEEGGPAPAGSSAEPQLPLEAAPSAPSSGEASPATASVLTAVRLLLKETKTGAFAGKVDRLAEELGKTPEEFLAALMGAGLKVPEKSREKPAFVEHGVEIFWLNKNAKDELWLNAKTSKFAGQQQEGQGDEMEKKSRRSRPRKRETA
jgi:hypothetical protein